MKFNHSIPIVAVLAAITLFFFPEPETNFFAYSATAIVFAIIIIFIILANKKK